MDPLLRYVRVMLCGKYNCFQAERLSVLIILYGNLALAIRDGGKAVCRPYVPL